MPAGLGDNICIEQMVKRLTASQLDEALSQIRRTGAIEQYKRARDEYQMHEAWQAAQKARNMQHEYGRLKEALSRKLNCLRLCATATIGRGRAL